MTPEEFSELRYGMFVHFGLFSVLARGEWVMNREQIPPAEMRKVAERFRPDKFDADEICDLAVEGGMKYIVFTTMHHEGFRMYDTQLTDYCVRHFCGRDLVKEIMDSARRHGLKIGLYHSLNNWYDQPDAAAALENPRDYELFIEHTFARLSELVEKYRPFDILWYDGWWPFNSRGWQAERMNDAMRKLQPGLLFNGRNGLPGDFGTPEQHLTAPDPWRPWEACITLNSHWGYHAGDSRWKAPEEVIRMLHTCAVGRGNLLLNIGPCGDGSIPEESKEIIRKVGGWLRNGGREAITGIEPMPMSPMMPKPGDRGDWDNACWFTSSGCDLFCTVHSWPGERYVLTGLNAQVSDVIAMGSLPLKFTQEGGKISIELPAELKKETAPVLKLVCDRVPAIYRTGGMRVPACPHPRYDPLPPDIQY